MNYYRDENGNGRGYVAQEGGALETVIVPIIDGEPINSWGIPYTPTGETRALVGWPDKEVAVMEEVGLMIAFEEKKMYINIHTGSVDSYDGWNYEDETGFINNAVDAGEVIEVIDDGHGGWIEAEEAV